MRGETKSGIAFGIGGCGSPPLLPCFWLSAPPAFLLLRFGALGSILALNFSLSCCPKRKERNKIYVLFFGN